MADKDYSFWGRVKRRPESHYYDVQRDEYVKKDVPKSLLEKRKKGWTFDRELNLWVKRELDNIQFAVDGEGKRTFTLDQVIRDNPERAREILNTLKEKVRPEDRWLQGYVKDYEGRLGTGLLGVDRGKGLLTYG